MRLILGLNGENLVGVAYSSNSLAGTMFGSIYRIFKWKFVPWLDLIIKGRLVVSVETGKKGSC